MTDTYKDRTASINERVADLLGRMTLDEKVAQLGAIWLTSLVRDERFDPDQVAELLANGIGQVTRIGVSTGLLANESAQLANAIQKVLVERTRLGIPTVIHEEGVGGFLHRGATTFPQGLGLAATWNTDLMAEVAEGLAGIGAAIDGDGTGTDQLPEASGAYAAGPHYTPHVTPLAGLRVALGETEITYALGCVDSGDDTSGIAEAVAAAAAAGVAIVCVGVRSGLVMDCTVGEARDATDLGLPGVQPRLVSEVAATGTPTVVVVISGRVHTLQSEAEAADALVWSILPGEEGGNAIADILTGAINPAGVT